MKRRVKITGLPKMKNGGGLNSDKYYPSYNESEQYINTPDTEVNNSLKPVPREEANIEAEKGEYIYTNMTADMLPELYMVGGDKHYNGGTPLNVPEGSFVYSDSKDLKIKDKDILKEFGMGGKKGATPAKLASKFKINDYKNIINDPNADKISKDTAMLMLKNNSESLGKLALVQESMKGFPEGIPNVSMEYLASIGVDPQEILPQGVQEMPEETMMKSGGKVPCYTCGGHTKYQTGGPIIDPEFMNRQAEAQGRRATVNLPEENIEGDQAAQSLGAIESWLGRMSQEDQAILREKIKNEIANSDRLSAAEKKKLNEMSFNDAIGSYLDLTKQTYAYADDIKSKRFTEADVKSDRHKKWDRGAKGHKVGYKEWAKEKGIEEMSPEKAGMAQAMYNAIYDYQKENPDAFKYMDDSGNEWEVKPTPVGNPDHHVKGEGIGISPVDQVIGDTTIGQTTIAEKVKEAEKTPEPQPEEKADTLPTVPFAEAKNEDPNRWWMEDIIKTAGAASDLHRIQKYLPWAPNIDVQTMDPTYYDPTRALAANAEQANIAADASAKFSGPQALGARLSRIQGEAAKNAANIMAQYDERNVGVANQFEQMNKQAINQGNVANAQRLVDLYDKTTIANQQYDNAKAKGRENLRQSYIDGLHRAFKNQIVNEMYPQYDFDPLTREFGRSGPGRPITGSGSYDNNTNDLGARTKKYNELKAQYPGAPDSWIKKEVENTMPVKSPANTYKDNTDVMNMMQSIFGGFNS